MSDAGALPQREQPRQRLPVDNLTLKLIEDSERHIDRLEARNTELTNEVLALKLENESLRKVRGARQKL